MYSDYDFEVVWAGNLTPPWGHERGELLSGEMRCECSALAKLISPFELYQLEHRKQAETYRKNVWLMKCRHDPSCVNYPSCIEAIALSIAKGEQP